MMLFELLKAFLFGVVEGITEWLPISSTGHMILLDQFVQLDVSKDFYSMFEVVIQLGAILAVVVIYWHKIWPFHQADKNTQAQGIWRYVDKDIMIMWLKIFIACLPAGIIGVAFNDTFERLFYNPTCVAIALIVFGIAFILIEDIHKNKQPKITSIAELSYYTVVLIGFFQLIAAVFPGTSRSGATIVGALILGVSRTVATEFTFFLAIPVMFGAALFKLVKFGFSFTPLEIWILVVGLVTAFITSIIAIKFLMQYIKKHTFKAFGWYRIILGLLVIAYFWFVK
ncbi:undecaprenyl-diphosphate phosphatase [Lactobacillus murinus]|uniref:Undecaprenyl-diphosphatase n=2 Tax=Ligilactobacillus murinus TaxID=1622 RepID=A0AAE6WJ34_9LACO|nr:undecaprenyl-diphosphate phosphatase [Ligilactobacillus murinus]NEF84664.1 undecaprenyl-diphosphate phosphatase [Ligilactobacillus murinus]NEF87025.1 undecaprenyl-diphosphate phosphatase [Ligilactobacillus murinus]NEF89305.1 undecaprenyl-diphosphate phosphatase [Ligilactobacillus murinus]NEF91536.1 undecaprenyl-diphosphate phosphatase [Ligilactobacillus murinus]